jgi:uncharacterized SAM-binding protein YcdF (DUF218 family)
MNSSAKIGDRSSKIEAVSSAQSPLSHLPSSRIALSSISQLPSPAQARPRRRRLLLALLAFCFLLSAFYIFRARLFAGMAKAWIVNEPVAHADAIVVLGGGPETRPFAAARLYHEGFAPRLLITNTKARPSTASLGSTYGDAEYIRQMLLKLDVPASNIVVVGPDNTSTYEESVAIRDWVQTHAAKVVIIPTDSFHTRRVRWLFGKQLSRVGARVIVEAVPVREYADADWWRHGNGVTAFQNEIIKYLYYRIKY